MADAWGKGRDFIEALCEHLKQLDATVHDLRERIKVLEARPVVKPPFNIEGFPKRSPDYDELRQKIDELLSRPVAPTNPFYPPPGHPYPYWVPTWTCGEMKTDNRPMWNGSSP